MAYRWNRNKGANSELHPLIHTSLRRSLAQDVAVLQCFAGFGNDPPQIGDTSSSGLTKGVSLHMGHLTGWTVTRLISLEPGFVIGLFRVRKFWLWWAETGKSWVSPVAVPAENMVIACRPRNMLVTAWAMLGRFWRETLVFCHLRHLTIAGGGVSCVS